MKRNQSIHQEDYRDLYDGLTLIFAIDIEAAVDSKYNNLLAVVWYR